jgi:hypothetical protein
MMMKKICGTITILILAAAMIALAACSNILDPPQSKQEAETGTVYIVIDGDSAGDRAAARTLTPDQTNFTRYTASFSGPGTHGDVDITVGNSSPISLVPGEWTITVTASIGAYPSYTEAGRGSVAVSVESGQPATANITITPITGGSGDFRYSVAIPAVDSATLSLTNITPNTTVPGISINLKTAADSFGGIAAATRNLNAGYYRMNIRLGKSGKYAGRTEVVHIYNGLVTEAVYAFTDNDFGAVGSLADGIWQDGEMTTNGSEYHRFSVTAGETYEVYWNDSYQGNSTKTLDIRASAYYETGEVSIFSSMDSGYTTPQVFTAASNDNVIIRIYPYSSGSIGTYAVKYNTVAVPVTVDTVTVSPPTAVVARGGTETFSATVTGTGSPAQTVTWTVSGNSNIGTTISAAGLLAVAAGETATSLTVRATSTVDTTKSGTAAVTVPVPPTVSSVTVSPATASVAKGGTQTFSATVTGTGSPAQTVTWTVNGNDNSGTTISGGVLNVAVGETATNLTVRATSTVDTAKSGTATIMVTMSAAEMEAEAFKTAYSMILNKPVADITLADEGYVNAALDAFDILSQAVKNLLDAEKSWLDSLKAKIDTLGVGLITLVNPTDVASGALSNNPITIAKIAGSYETTHTLTVIGDFDSYRWRVDGSARGSGKTFILRAEVYPTGTHQISLEVTLNGAVYSKSGSFTVAP